ncbi:hypothetical protein Q0590_35685 [Rhodocytophaga aerolata]|uniref:Diadenosine tetraphosphate hydrolase n=1 Tax=Rhodocytophaga aerolata TaxID=455078 RepID=A0ABT8RHV5_9BACT|nr:hypothetical protein [Rhodocytophaga aerolata]MDO1451670.1 hypothetical protein [Rhodocytophaga aerolata]
MSPSITSADGSNLEVECLSCALVSGVVPPTGGVIFESAHFHVHQDVAYPIRGLVIVAAKRHFYCLDELTAVEQTEFISLVHKLRHEQRIRLGIEKVYYFYNEDTTHHFHFWMVPRYAWMDQFGRSVESLRPVLLYARNNMNDEKNRKTVLEGISALQAGMKAYK